MVHQLLHYGIARGPEGAALDNKALVLARELVDAFGDVVTVEPVPDYVTPGNVTALVRDGTIVFLAVDNHATRRLVATAVESLRDVVLISGGNDGVEPEAGRTGTYGNVQLVWRAQGAWRTSPLTRHHPEIAAAVDESRSARAASSSPPPARRSCCSRTSPRRRRCSASADGRSG